MKIKNLHIPSRPVKLYLKKIVIQSWLEKESRNKPKTKKFYQLVSWRLVWGVKKVPKWVLPWKNSHFYVKSDYLINTEV